MSIDQLPLTSGPIRGSADFYPVLLKDSETISGLFSGRFFTIDSNGLAVICDDDTQTISGWIESGTVSSTSTTYRPAILAPSDVIFRLPVTGGALTQTHVGQLFDLDVISNIQYVDVTASTHDLVLCVGGLFGTTAALSYIDVKINTSEMYMG